MDTQKKQQHKYISGVVSKQIFNVILINFPKNKKMLKIYEIKLFRFGQKMWNTVRKVESLRPFDRKVINHMTQKRKKSNTKLP